jgi:hypothetical protein
MVIKLLDSNSIVTRTIGRVRSFLKKSSDDLLITFEDLSEIEIKENEYDAFIVEGINK